MGVIRRDRTRTTNNRENHFPQNIFISCILSAWAKTIWLFNNYFQSECLLFYCKITFSLIKYIYIKPAIPRTHYFFNYLMLLIGVRPEQINSSLSINSVCCKLTTEAAFFALWTKMRLLLLNYLELFAFLELTQCSVGLGVFKQKLHFRNLIFLFISSLNSVSESQFERTSTKQLACQPSWLYEEQTNVWCYKCFPISKYNSLNREVLTSQLWE